MSLWAELQRDAKRTILRRYLVAGGSVSEAARRLGIQRTYLVRLKRELGVEGRRDLPSEPKATAE